ncbi:hypothetical protein DL96DRAFT_584 [Flagelloscypha sp. PMI_526]|nr:hypothetical protein DL96DRAFT_584 [Flagelloscypha sp. PMI_526]
MSSRVWNSRRSKSNFARFARGLKFQPSPNSTCKRSFSSVNHHHHDHLPPLPMVFFPRYPKLNIFSTVLLGVAATDAHDTKATATPRLTRQQFIRSRPATSTRDSKVGHRGPHHRSDIPTPHAHPHPTHTTPGYAQSKKMKRVSPIHIILPKIKIHSSK